jgi:hypothetical protein
MVVGLHRGPFVHTQIAAVLHQQLWLGLGEGERYIEFFVLFCFVLFFPVDESKKMLPSRSDCNCLIMRKERLKSCRM